MAPPSPSPSPARGRGERSEAMRTHRVYKMIALGIALAAAAAAPARAEQQLTPADVLKHYDDTMSPRTFDALMTMVAHRQDGTTRGYKFRALKLGDDKIRLWFFEPASAKGQEMLRVGDNMWV